MTKISDYADKQTQTNTKLQAAFDGLQKDITRLNKLVAKLQSTPDVITAEDQKLLDAIQTQSEAIAKNFSALDIQGGQDDGTDTTGGASTAPQDPLTDPAKTPGTQKPVSGTQNPKGRPHTNR